MNYEKFKRQLVSQIRARAGEDAEVELLEIPKNNGVVCEAVVLKRPQSRVAPAFYLEDFYDLCCEGETLEVLAAGIWEQFEREVPDDLLSPDFFTRWENVRQRIYPRLINYEMNRAQLAELPHLKWMDFAVVFFYWVEEETLEDATVLIRDEHLKMWGILGTELSDAAIANSQRDLPPYFGDLCGLLDGLVGEREEAQRALPMYILTNRKKQFGAACLLYPGILECMSRRIKSDYYILPSSIHECIVVPVSGNYSSQELKEMVTEINGKYVHPQEVLANAVYEYSRKERRLISR